MSRLPCGALIWLVLGSTTAQVQSSPRPMTAVDMVEMPKLSSPALSPDGKVLLYRISNTDWQKNKRVSRYRLLDVASGETTAGPPAPSLSETVREALWHPQGTGFVTLHKGDEDQFRQIYAYSFETGSYERLTRHGSSVSEIIWHPDGARLFFIAPAQDDPAYQSLIEDDWVIRAAGVTRNREIWQLDLETGRSRPLVTGSHSVRDVSISRNGDHIVYRRVPSHDNDASHDGDVWSLSLTSGAQTRWTANQYKENDPVLSPGGDAIAYIATVNDKLEPYYEDKVFVHARGSRLPQRLLADIPMEALSLAWDADGVGIFILGNTGLRTDLFHYTLATGQLRQLSRGDHVVDDWIFDADTGIHVARISNQSSPGEFHLKRGLMSAFEQISDEYKSWRDTFRLPQQHAVSWEGRDGVKIEGLLVYPLDHDLSTRYPMVTITHGGPRSSAQFGSWNVSRYVSVLAGYGYAVLLPNHRGGTGYGDAFMRDMYGAYFRNAHHDVLAGVDEMVRIGIADPDRLIKMGWSAGGHMVNKLITVTNRFKAASSGAGAADWLSMHGESDARHNRRWIFGGSPWEASAPHERYLADSPLKDAWRVTTPTLFFSGEKDVRVPPTQAIMMHRGIRAAGVPSQLYIADDQPHNFRKPSFRLFKINTELSWYAKHALGGSYAAVLPIIARQKHAERRPVVDSSDAVRTIP